jgi:acetyltransferase-like isoleucine patch superfamily enzyme
MRRKLIESIRWKLVAGRFGRLIREAAQLPYVYDGTPNPGRRVFLGQKVRLNNATLNVVSGDIRIGDYSFLGSGVSLLTGTHDYSLRGPERQTASPASGRDIVIGSGVWIASNATVMGPCRIGDDAVVAAGAVVTMPEVPAGAIVGGIPARVMGHVDGG